MNHFVRVQSQLGRLEAAAALFSDIANKLAKA